MDKLYFFVTNCSTWQNNDPNQYLSNYFVDGGGFLNSFLVALIVAVIFAAIFYGWIGMAVDRLSSLSVWLVTLVADAVVTFFATKMIIIGSEVTGSGLFNSITAYQEQLSSQIPVNDAEGHRLLSAQTSQLVDIIAHNGDVVYSLLIGNAIISVILFFIISICVKGVTTNATHVPF